MIYDRPKKRTIRGNTVEYRRGVSFQRREHSARLMEKSEKPGQLVSQEAYVSRKVKEKSYKRHGE